MSEFSAAEYDLLSHGLRSLQMDVVTSKVDLDPDLLMLLHKGLPDKVDRLRRETQVQESFR